MITGRVASDGSEAVIRLGVRGSTGRTLQVEAVIDTGFTDTLSLRPQDIDDLRLPWLGHVEATLADETKTTADVYTGEVLWDDESRRITIAAIETTLLVGMKLMKNYRLTLDVIPGGPLRLERMESPENADG